METVDFSQFTSETVDPNAETEELESVSYEIATIGQLTYLENVDKFDST